MKRNPGLLLATTAASALALGLAGCGLLGSKASKPAAAQRPPPAPVAGQPHILTNLNALAPQGSAPATALRTPEAATKAVSGTGGPRVVRGALTSAGTVRYAGSEMYPAEEQLLNDKAARFNMLSNRLLGQLLTQMQSLEREAPISGMRLPTELKPVIVTGTLDANGQLKELVLEQHSGQAAVDKMVITACKNSLYLHNAPPEALTADGNYKVRVNARISNFSSPEGTTWTFKTFLGIALL